MIKKAIILLILAGLSFSGPVIFAQLEPIKTKEKNSKEKTGSAQPVKDAAYEKKVAEKGRMLETIGSLSTTNLYMGYISLTLLKNEIDNGLASDPHDQILQSLKKTLGLMKLNLEDTKKNVVLVGSDLKFIEDILNMCDVLIEDSELLYVYFKSKDQKDAGNFMNQHKLTWETLQKVMGPVPEK